MMRKESVKPDAPVAKLCRASAIDRSKRITGPRIWTSTDNAMKRHKQPAAISKPSAAEYLLRT